MATEKACSRIEMCMFFRCRSKSLHYVVQNIANKGLPNGNISGSLEDEQILSREDILHKSGGKNGLSNLK